MMLSLTDGRGYGMLAWAIDPETGGPVRMRVSIPGVVIKEYNWNYRWHDMPHYTGVNRTESLDTTRAQRQVCQIVHVSGGDDVHRM